MAKKDFTEGGREPAVYAGRGPAPKQIPKLKKNKPGKSVGIRYLDDGMQTSFSTRKNYWRKK